MSTKPDGYKYDIKKIRNFSIIAHIDHGKSTIADRLLEVTQTVSQREMQAQLLDDMELERERGITIKAHPVTMYYKAKDGEYYQINFIDTPGHVDFSYEVSRSLSACEGALLVIDCAQGVQAQSLANVYLALERDLEILPILNKVDLPAANIEGTKEQIEEVIGLDCTDALCCSAKTGVGIEPILEEIIHKFPHPDIKEENAPLRALVFDSHYDVYRGVMTYLRVVSGEVRKGMQIKMMATGSIYEVTEVGIFAPNETATDSLKPGEVGYLIGNIKTTSDVKIGDTITTPKNPADKPLPGFKEVSPVVYAGIYPIDSSDLETLKEALEKLKLNDAALHFETESNTALGIGFRCGFLGLLHLEIIFERLQREFNLDVITTAPSVIYRFSLSKGEVLEIDNVTHYPDPSKVKFTEEPWAKSHIMIPAEYLGPVMTLIRDKRGDIDNTEAISDTRMLLTCRLPMNEIITDFSDTLKSITKGYGSFDYEFEKYEKSDIVKLEVRVNEEPVDAFSCMVHRSKADFRGRALCKKLKDVIPRQMFKVPIQAAIGGKIIARETISALSKNVTAKCYGGDVSRKRKLLEKQKKGKAKMKEFGKVQIPQDAFMKVLKND